MDFTAFPSLMNDVVFFMSMTTLMTSKYTFLQKANAVGEFNSCGYCMGDLCPEYNRFSKGQKVTFLFEYLFIYFLNYFFLVKTQ